MNPNQDKPKTGVTSENGNSKNDGESSVHSQNGNRSEHKVSAEGSAEHPAEHPTEQQTDKPKTSTPSQRSSNQRQDLKQEAIHEVSRLPKDYDSLSGSLMRQVIADSLNGFKLKGSM